MSMLHGHVHPRCNAAEFVRAKPAECLPIAPSVPQLPDHHEPMTLRNSQQGNRFGILLPGNCHSLIEE
jgi:hypothetical protein